MKNFIPAIRTDRLREMKAYEEKGYVIQKKNEYLKLDTIEVDYMGDRYSFGVEVTRNEVYFFITRDSSNIYLSISDIYGVLRKSGGRELLDSMKEQLSGTKGKSYFYYQNIGYILPKIVPMSLSEKVEIPCSGMKVSYTELFVLLNLIQGKSNALFQRSMGENKKYINGIWRLLITLLKMKQEIPLLSKLGWHWDEKSRCYIFDWNESEDRRTKYKYYLTNDEYITIIK